MIDISAFRAEHGLAITPEIDRQLAVLDEHLANVLPSHDAMCMVCQGITAFLGEWQQEQRRAKMRAEWLKK